MSEQSVAVQPAAGQVDKTNIASLRHQIRGQVLTPSDTGYEDARLIWNGMFDRKPALVVHCQDKADVVAAVNFARDNKLLTAVRGGGHNSSGSGSCDGGIVIDLSGMKAVSVDPELRRAHVQGGATWADFDGAAQAHGLATPGGVVSATGVGGLTLAGGLGWLRGKFGLSIDNVVSAEIVTADGKVRVANASENADLFWALRGGGGNFGVVTRFEFALHPIGPEVMFLGAIYRADDAAQVIKGWRDFMKTGPDEIGGSLAEYSTIPEDPGYPKETWGKRVLSLVGVWAGDTNEGERAVEPLRRLATPLIDMSGRMSYCSIQQMYDAMFPKGGHRAYFKSVYLNGLDDTLIDEIAVRSTDRPSDLSLCSVWYMGGAVSRVAGDATAFGERDMQYMLSIDSIWKDRRDDERNLSWSRAFWHDMKGRSDGRAYLNFAGLGEEGENLVRTSYGAQNYQRLAAIKAKYDPTNMFRLNQNIKPLVAADKVGVQ
jgi:FAD/FMN-containing dehydrogenase